MLAEFEADDHFKTYTRERKPSFSANCNALYSLLSPLFAQEPTWRLRASLTEGYLFLPQLKEKSRKILPRGAMVEDKYLEYIPLTWTAINILKRSYPSASVLQETTVISMLNYQADEYMEAVVGRHYSHKLQPIEYITQELCEEPGKIVKGFNGLASKKIDFRDQVPTKGNPMISAENSSFLESRILDLASGRDCPEILDTDKGSLAFTNTVHDQPSASMNKTGVHEVGNEAGTMIECNLKSINFSEFRPTGVHIDGQQNEDKVQEKEDALKSALFGIAEYERESLVRASQSLKKVVSTKVAKVLDLFVGVTDLYGQINVAKDIASLMN
ncbi:MAG: hypothetical protein Q9191_002126 [Dirinaria sp. TL-2023a]